MKAKATFNANKLHMEIMYKKKNVWVSVGTVTHVSEESNWENRWSSSYILDMMPEVLLNFI